MICLIVDTLAKAGFEKEVAAIYKKLALESRKEPGCTLYVVHTDPENPRRFFLYEQYTDGAAVAHHRASMHFKQFAEVELGPLLEKRDLAMLNVMI